MGGVQVIFTGDFFQLPPVQDALSPIRENIHDKENNPGLINSVPVTLSLHKGSNDSQKRKRFCFESSVWDCLFPCRPQSSYLLAQSYRQKEQQFVSLLNSIRWGEISDNVLEEINRSVGREIDCSDGILPTRICTHRSKTLILNLLLTILEGLKWMLSMLKHSPPLTLIVR
jgi:ATP-dependent DNA helicase PIF1